MEVCSTSIIGGLIHDIEITFKLHDGTEIGPENSRANRTVGQLRLEIYLHHLNTKFDGHLHPPFPSRFCRSSIVIPTHQRCRFGDGEEEASFNFTIRDKISQHFWIRDGNDVGDKNRGVKLKHVKLFKGERKLSDDMKVCELHDGPPSTEMLIVDIVVPMIKEKLMNFSENFEAKLFLSRVHQDTSGADLKSGALGLKTDLKGRTQQRKLLVKDNFDCFVSCKTTIDGILAQTEKIRSVQGMLQRFRTLFNLPSTICGSISKGEHDLAVREYKKAK
ncbi:hypothetical protein Dsin_016645 [Dipteronia sinensis]|uniref:Exocyst complex component SEC5 n=1 Tax=Dipteronia sinensis TaxID=43782 RepID=A0AAE0E5T6_9ROSI|nr:hypothetical protein Dsin_016645 [Dipteronia sinensis]